MVIRGVSFCECPLNTLPVEAAQNLPVLRDVLRVIVIREIEVRRGPIKANRY